MNYCDPSNLIILHWVCCLVYVLFWRVRVYLPSGSRFSPKVVFVLQLVTVQDVKLLEKSVDKSTAFIIFQIRNFTLVRLFAFQFLVSSILNQRSSFRSFEAEHLSAASANLLLF